jgi:hypothetical protein
MSTMRMIGLLVAVLLMPSIARADETLHAPWFHKVEEPKAGVAGTSNGGGAAIALPVMGTFTAIHTMIDRSPAAGILGVGLLMGGALAGARMVFVMASALTRHRLVVKAPVLSISPAPIVTRTMMGLALVGKF